MEPLPPVKEVEYRCYIGKLFEELSGTEHMTFAFETAKEFSSFRYEIAVRYRIQPGLLEFKVLGMTATRTMMPAFGTARSVLKVPLLPYGIYNVRMIKSDDTENMFSIEVSKKGFQILQPIPRKRFIDLVVEDSASAPNARHLSTVSKMPPQPLVPRTIQKRQPGPMDAAHPDSFDFEDEHERPEEEDIFDTPPPKAHEAKAKSGAKHPIDEIEEVPMSAKGNGKPKPASKPEKTIHEKPVHEKAIHEKPVHEKTIHEKPVHEKAIHEKSVHEKAIHEKKGEHKPAKSDHKPAKAEHTQAKATSKKSEPKKLTKPAHKSKPAKIKSAKKNGKKK